MNILISTNDRFVLPTQVMLYSLCENNKDEDVDIYLAYHDLSDRSISEIQRVLCRFKNKILHLMDVGEEFSKKVPQHGEFTAEIYYRILAINLLPKDMHRILYLDCDMIVKGSLKDVFDYCIDNAPFGVCEDFNSHIACYDCKTGAGVPQNKKYFNSGCLLMNLDYLRENKCADKIIERFVNEHDKYKYIDQDILNNEYMDQVVYIPWKLYNLAPVLCHLDLYGVAEGKVRYATYNDMNYRVPDYDRRYKDITDIVMEKSIVIHYLGDTKPWNHREDEIYWVHEMYKHFWFEYEKKMLEAINI